MAGLEDLPHDEQGRLVLSERAAARFWQKVGKAGADECWEWLASRSCDNYGSLGIGGATIKAHRISFELHCGVIPDGLVVRHLCNNPPCVNPRHLRLGTQADNVHDRGDTGAGFRRPFRPTGFGRPPGYRPTSSRIDPITRFLLHIEKNPDSDGCWVWIGYGDRKRYADFKVDGRYVKAHRFAYETFVGTIPDGMVIMHSCDNPPCVNPAHLSVGSYSDNLKDAYAKGRLGSGEQHHWHINPPKGTFGDRNGMRKDPRLGAEAADRLRRWRELHPDQVLRGSHNPNASLTESLVHEIKERLRTGEPCRRIARDYSVSASTIEHIARDLIWRHVS